MELLLQVRAAGAQPSSVKAGHWSLHSEPAVLMYSDEILLFYDLFIKSLIENSCGKKLHSAHFKCVSFNFKIVIHLIQTSKSCFKYTWEILPHPSSPSSNSHRAQGSHYFLSNIFQIIPMLLSASTLFFLPFACYAYGGIYIYFPAPC